MIKGDLDDAELILTYCERLCRIARKLKMPPVDAPPGHAVSTRLELTRLVLVERFVDTDSSLNGVVRACHSARRFAAG